MNKRRDQQENEMGIWMKLYKEKKKKNNHSYPRRFEV